MSGGSIPSVFRSAMLAAWALATLVLFFTVVLLAYEYYRAGNAGGAEISGITAVAIQADDDESVAETEVTLYFGSTGGLELVPERRLVALSANTVENCKRAFRELADGPRSPLVRLVDSGASIRGAYLTSEGTLVLDVARGVNVPEVGSATAEALMIRSIVATLTQTSLRGREGPSVRSVEFLYEGAIPTRQFPSHMQLSESVVATRRWQSAERDTTDE